mmetsp:Transcript_4558/g.10638  ORF Transcript_4558/g.10638 Transcript_4558/m.10638 type:complete len:511 (-) Transcript_4558:116-1648(-)
MSWYVGQDGQQIWIRRDEVVYTVVRPREDLPLETLTYLSVNSKKATFQEHLTDDIDEECKGPKNSRRHRDKLAGRQRGFLVRVDVEQSRVIPCVKEATKRLLDKGVASRIDADEASNAKKNKKKENMEVKILGVNECRVETTARVYHFAHGPGFRIEVSEGPVQQTIHVFTGRKEISPQDWHSQLMSAVEANGAHVVLSRRVRGDADAEVGEVQRHGRKDMAQQDDDAWFESALRECMHVNQDGNVIEEEQAAKPAENRTSEAGETLLQPRERPPTEKPPEPPKAAPQAPSISRAKAEQVPEWRRRTAQQQPQTQPSQRQARGAPSRADELKLRAEARQGWAPSVVKPKAPPRLLPQPAWQAAPAVPASQARAQASQARTPAPQASAQAHRAPQPAQLGMAQGADLLRLLRTPVPPPEASRCEEPAAVEPAWEKSWDKGWDPSWEPSRARWQRWQATSQATSHAPEHPAGQQAQCGECGNQSKLFVDSGDGRGYCRSCWISYYGSEPPNV